MPIKLTCVEKDFKNQIWEIDLEGEQVLLFDADGAIAAQLEHDVAPGQFQMPSFSESIKTFGVEVDGRLLRFNVDKPDLQQIKAYLTAHLAASGPGVLNAMRNKALGRVALGVLIAGGGAAYTVLSYQAAANNPQGGEYTITHGIILFGLIILGKGVYDLVQYNKAKKIAG